MHCCSGEEQHSLPQNSQEENSCGMSCGWQLPCQSCLATTQLLGGRGEPHTSQLPRFTMRQRQGKLLEELDLSGLASWPPELVDSA